MPQGYAASLSGSGGKGSVPGKTPLRNGATVAAQIP